MKRPRIYLSGPITGTTDYKERFEEAAFIVQCMGFKPVNPTTMFGWLQPLFSICPYRFQVFVDCMVLAIFCKAIYLMKDHDASRGARLEKAVADFLQMHTVLAGSDSEKPITGAIKAVADLGRAFASLNETIIKGWSEETNCTTCANSQQKTPRGYFCPTTGETVNRRMWCEAFCHRDPSKQ